MSAIHTPTDNTDLEDGFETDTVRNCLEDDPPPVGQPVYGDAQYVQHSPSSPTAPTPLPHEIERTTLALQVRALERSVVDERRRNQALVAQYERRLADHTPTAERRDDGLLERLRTRFRGLFSRVD